jgi:hypothetical protein
MKLEAIEDVEIYLRTFAAMTEGDVRRWVHTWLPTPAERLVFDDLSRGCSKETVDLVAARALVRAKIGGAVCTR